MDLHRLHEQMMRIRKHALRTGILKHGEGTCFGFNHPADWADFMDSVSMPDVSWKAGDVAVWRGFEVRERPLNERGAVTVMRECQPIAKIDLNTYVATLYN